MVNPADTIMQQVLKQASVYSAYIHQYHAKAYVKGSSKVLKNNVLLRYVPKVFAFDRRGGETLMEALVDIKYEAPNHYTQQITALTGTRVQAGGMHEIAMQFLNLNMYNSSMLNNQIAMPFGQGASKYYKYHYEGCSDTLFTRMHQIRIEPRWESPKLLTARAYIVDGTWNVAFLEASGLYDYFRFYIKISCGSFYESFLKAKQRSNYLLPTQVELLLDMDVLGNHVQNSYTSLYNYLSLVHSEDKPIDKQKEHDLTEFFYVSKDSVIVRDSLFWEKERPIPLKKEEKELYARYNGLVDTVKLFRADTWQRKTWRFSKVFIEPHKFNYKETKFRYSGILNPLKIGYSSRKGFSYSQKLKLERQFHSNKRELGFYPDVGYLFRQKELLANLPLQWLYNPKRMGAVGLSAGIGNRGLDSRTITEINTHLKDSTFSFSDFRLDYYKDWYTKLTNKVEITNGLLFTSQLAYHWRKPVVKTNDLLDADSDEAIEILRSPFASFEPSIGLVWTPGQYYRYEGKKKIYVGSLRPTFSIQYTRGLKKILGSDGNFERLEVDVQQRIPIGSFSCVQYYAGAGKFTNSDELHFVSFSKLTRNNFPESWKDKVGGVYHLLDDYWYYASDSYVQLHAMYESPFLFMNFFRKASRFVFSERLYLSQLYLPSIMPSYTELGYGIGNFLFNVGVFAGFEDLKFTRVGVKFAFELFN